MVKSTPILCRVCKRKMGTVPHFEGRVYTLCTKCERALKAAKKRGFFPPTSEKP